eukprot:6194491-Pleurochrysis_carterae.AAC.1
MARKGNVRDARLPCAAANPSDGKRCPQHHGDSVSAQLHGPLLGQRGELDSLLEHVQISCPNPQIASMRCWKTAQWPEQRQQT